MNPGSSADRRDRAYFHSQFAFLRGMESSVGEHFLCDLDGARDRGEVFCSGAESCLWVRYLSWDSEYFSVPTYRIEFVDFDPSSASVVEVVSRGLADLRTLLQARHDSFYLFAEVPSEDTAFLQALGLDRWRLIETRLTYFNDKIAGYGFPRRAAVREATEADVACLRNVAVEKRNLFDRFHADPFFGEQLADHFLGVFVENSVRGFADVVLVPDVGQQAPDAFLTGKLIHASELSAKPMGRMVLSAVADSRRGWYPRLISEMSYWFQAQGCETVFMTTQSTNRAVVRVWESLGFRLGRSAHVFSTFFRRHDLGVESNADRF